MHTLHAFTLTTVHAKLYARENIFILYYSNMNSKTEHTKLLILCLAFLSEYSLHTAAVTNA